MSERCEMCRFSKHTGRGLACLRYPPTPLVADADLGSKVVNQVVITAPAAWCGEWRAKAQEPAKPKEREPGWYWVKGSSGGDWELARWSVFECWEGHWRRVMDEQEWADSDLAEIDERRIERQP